MGRSAFGCLLFGFLLFLGAPRAAAQQPATSADEAIASLREMMLYARYPEAINGARTYLQRTDLSATERNLGIEILATAEIANGERTARTTLALLYSRDPNYRLSDPDASPVVQSAFARARDAHPAPLEVPLELAPTSVTRHESPSVEVRLTSNADAVQEVRLYYRARGSAVYDVAVMRPSADRTSARGTIPLAGPAEQPYEVEFYVEALTPSRYVLGHAGSATEPSHVTVPAETRTVRIIERPGPGVGPVGGGRGGGGEGGGGGGVLSRWWFWTAVGVVVAGGVAGYVLLGPPSDGPSDGSLGSVRLR